MENPRDLRDERRQLFVHTGQWLEWLAAQGGDLACGVVPPGSALDLLGYDVLLARCKTDRARLEPAELLAFVEARVPRYMLPAQLRVLERLPVTGNGKIDRKALTGFARQPQADLRHGVAQAPADELENALLALWREVLDNPSLGVEQDFFGAGGDSLLIAQLIARLRERLESARRHPFDRLLRWALSQPTPRGLAERLRSAPEEGRGPALAAARGVARRRPACRAHRSPRARWRSTRWCAWCPARACRGCWSTKASARCCRTARCFAPWVRGGRCWGWPCMTATPTWRSPPSISTPASAAATPRRSMAPGCARSTCSATAPAGWSPWRPPSP